MATGVGSLPDCKKPPRFSTKRRPKNLSKVTSEWVKTDRGKVLVNNFRGCAPGDRKFGAMSPTEKKAQGVVWGATGGGTGTGTRWAGWRENP